MAADGSSGKGRFFNASSAGKKKRAQPAEAPSGKERQFDDLVIAFLRKRDPEKFGGDGEKRLRAVLAGLSTEDKESRMRQYEKDYSLTVSDITARFEESAAEAPPEPVPAPELPKKTNPPPKAEVAWTPREVRSALEDGVRAHEERGYGKTKLIDRIHELTEAAERAKSKKAKDALLAQIRSLVTQNPRALEQELMGLDGAAEAAKMGERLAARATTDEEKISLIQQIAELVDVAQKERRLSDREVIGIISARIERGLAEKDAGLMSELNANSLRNGVNEAGLLAVGTAVRGVEAMTAGAYLSLLAQAVLKTTIVYSSPQGMAFNALCIAGALGILPITDRLKEWNFHEKGARKAWYDEFAKEEEREKPAEEVKKKKKVSTAKVILGTVAAGVAVGATDIATVHAPRIATMVAAQGPNMLSTAAALRQGHESESFVGETNAALEQASEQVGQVLREPRAEGYADNAPLPPMIESYHSQLEQFGDMIIRGELDGVQTETGGGSGSVGVGPSALRKMALFEGWFPGNYVDANDPRVRLLGPTARAWAFEQRSHFSYEMVNAEGQTVRVPIEFLTNADGSQESVPDWVERRYEAFEVKAQDLLLRFAQERSDLTDLSEYLADRLIPWNVKLDLMRARIQSTEGFTRDTEEIEATLHEIEELFRTEFTVPVQGLNESLISSLRQVGAGDEGMQLDAPQLQMNLELLENLEPPHSLSLDDLVNPAQISQLFMERNLTGQMLFMLLFGGIGLAELWKYNAGKGRARKQARVLRPKFKKMFGETYQEGDEYAIASEASGNVGEVLKEFLVGNGKPFGVEGLKSLMPFDNKGSWLSLSPEFVMFAMRLSGERSGEFPVAATGNPTSWLSMLGSFYGKGIASFGHGVSTIPEVKMYAKMEDRYRDRQALTKDLFSEMLPGFTELIFIGRRINTLQQEGKTAADKEVQELSTAFKNAYAEMVFGHLIARAQYARTKIDYYQKAYEDLKEHGKFDDLGVERLTNLPNLNIEFGGTTVELGENDIAKLEIVRKTGLRTMVIAEIERELAAERAELASIDRFVEEIEDKESLRIAELSTSFAPRLEELKRAVDRTVPIQSSGDRMVKDMTARGGLDRIVREQLQAEITAQVVEHRSHEAKTAKPKEYSVQEQYAALNQELQYTVHDAAGGESSLFIEDRLLNRFTCKPALEYRPRGHNGAIAEYYALSFRVTEQGKNDPIFESELPIQTLFAKELSPAQVATEVRRWIESKRNEASMVAKLYALEGDIAKRREDVELPASVNLSSNDAKSRLDDLFGRLIPKARIQDDLAQVEQALGVIEKRASEFDDATNLRRPKTRGERERRKRQRSKQKASYAELFQEVRKQERRLSTIERDRENLKPVFAEENQRAQSLVEFLRREENRRFLGQAKVSFEYLPDVNTRNYNIRLIDRRLTSLRKPKAEKVTELHLDDLMNILQSPRLRTDADRKKALLALFTTEGRAVETLRGNDRSGKRRAA